MNLHNERRQLYGTEKTDTSNTRRSSSNKSNGEDKTAWKDIGAGWENSDGSINLQLELLPTDPTVRLQIRNADEASSGANQ